jgi:hypothetical protein
VRELEYSVEMYKTEKEKNTGDVEVRFDKALALGKLIPFSEI